MINLKQRRYWVLLSLSFTFFSFSSNLEARDFPCRMIYQVSKMYLEHHINPVKVPKELRARVSEQFLRRFDPQKIYFLKKDAEAVRGNVKGFLLSGRNADCILLEKSRALFEAKVQEGFEFAKKFLDKSYKLDENTKIILDRKKLNFPKNAKEAEERQRKYLHFQMANYIAGDMGIEKAKKQLLHKMELNVKRVQKMKGNQIYSVYLDAFASSLDPHSSFFDKDALEDFQISMQLSLEGIGAVLSWEDGYTVIRQLVTGGAAAKSKELEIGDKVLGVAQGEDGEIKSVVDWDLRDVVKLIRGPKGTKVKLSILRKGDKAIRKSVVLARDKIKLEDEAAELSFETREVDGKKYKLAKIELPSFYSDLGAGGRSSTEDVAKLLKKAKEEKADGVLFDLSKNGGGALREAVGIGGLFIREGNVVAMQTSDGNIDYLADEDGEIVYNGPLVILTSAVTASASEIVTGALKDYGRAVVVGAEHTFGKGSVQTVIHVPYRLGATKVTSGMYFIPGGDSTQHHGVTADIVLPGLGGYEDIGEKTLDYSLPQAKIKSFLSNSVQAEKKEQKWYPIDAALTHKLAKLSRARVSKSEEFKKIKADFAKSKKEEKYLKIKDILAESADKKDKKKEVSSKEGPTSKEGEEKKGQSSSAEVAKEKDSKEKSPHIEEAFSILTDLIAAEGAASKQVANHL